jgi:hypothetical protein
LLREGANDLVLKPIEERLARHQDRCSSCAWRSCRSNAASTHDRRRAARNGDRVRLEPGWKARIGEYLQREDMQALSSFLRDARRRPGSSRRCPRSSPRSTRRPSTR